MGLFKNKSKPDKEALNKMWQEAYRANPRVYENPQDQSILAGLHSRRILLRFSLLCRRSSGR